MKIALITDQEARVLERLRYSVFEINRAGTLQGHPHDTLLKKGLIREVGNRHVVLTPQGAMYGELCDNN